MKPTRRAAWTLWGVTALALGAGVVAGLVVSRLSGGQGAAVASASEGNNLPEILHLSDQQRTQMRTIWEGTRDTARVALQDAEEAQHDRDNLVFSLLSQDQKLQYDRVTKQCAQKIDSLKAKRDQAVQDAIAQTKQILSAEQRQQYESLIQDRLGKTSPGVAQRDAVMVPALANAAFLEGTPSLDR